MRVTQSSLEARNWQSKVSARKMDVQCTGIRLKASQELAYCREPVFDQNDTQFRQSRKFSEELLESIPRLFPDKLAVYSVWCWFADVPLRRKRGSNSLVNLELPVSGLRPSRRESRQQVLIPTGMRIRTQQVPQPPIRLSAKFPAGIEHQRAKKLLEWQRLNQGPSRV